MCQEPTSPPSYSITSSARPSSVIGKISFPLLVDYGCAARSAARDNAAHVFDREIISGGRYAESHRRSDHAHDIDRSDPVNRADATAGTYHAAIAAGRACGQRDDQ